MNRPLFKSHEEYMEKPGNLILELQEHIKNLEKITDEFRQLNKIKEAEGRE